MKEKSFEFFLRLMRYRVSNSLHFLVQKRNGRLPYDWVFRHYKAPRPVISAPRNVIWSYVWLWLSMSKRYYCRKKAITLQSIKIVWHTFFASPFQLTRASPSSSRGRGTKQISNQRSFLLHRINHRAMKWFAGELLNYELYSSLLSFAIADLKHLLQSTRNGSRNLSCNLGFPSESYQQKLLLYIVIHLCFIHTRDYIFFVCSLCNRSEFQYSFILACWVNIYSILSSCTQLA